MVRRSRRWTMGVPDNAYCPGHPVLLAADGPEFLRLLRTVLYGIAVLRRRLRCHACLVRRLFWSRERDLHLWLDAYSLGIRRRARTHAHCTNPSEYRTLLGRPLLNRGNHAVQCRDPSVGASTPRAPRPHRDAPRRIAANRPPTYLSCSQLRLQVPLRKYALAEVRFSSAG